MKENGKAAYLATGICLSILVLFMLSIGVRLGTQQILIKRMRMENVFTHLVFWDQPNLASTSNIDIDWQALYPFEETEPVTGRPESWCFNLADSYATTVQTLKDKIERYSIDFLTGRGLMIGWYRNYNSLTNWRIPEICTDSKIIYMKNGYLAEEVPQTSEDAMAEIGNAVLDFSRYLEDVEIPLYYINAGGKVNPEDKELYPQDIIREFSNENQDALLKALSDRGINTLDLRETMLSEDLDWYAAYYKTDIHWKVETGLWAARTIAQMLNEQEGFEFDSHLFEESSYVMTTYEDCFLGELGRGCTAFAPDRESYTCILPRFETDFAVEIPSSGVMRAGSYKEALYDYEHLQNVLSYSDSDHLTLTQLDAYYSVTWRNDAVGIFKNNSTKDNADKKILMLQDSYSWYSTTYLACDAGEIHVIHPEQFDGSIRAYVKELQPDVVIVMYCGRNIKAIDLSSHTSMFDFR